MLIGEVAQRTGVSARMLRHYDRLGLVSPSERTNGGYRSYADDDVLRLFHVEALRSLGLGLPEVAAALDDPSFSAAAVVDRLADRTRQRLEQERELLARLEQVRAGAPRDWSDVLRTTGLLRGLGTADPSRRQQAALDLGSTTPAAVLLLDAALTEDDPNVAGALHWALARAGDEAVPVLAVALTGPDQGRNRQAVRALLKINSFPALTTLAGAHRHPDPWVRDRAVLARGRLGLPDAIPALVDLVAAGRDDVEAAEVLAGFVVGGADEQQVSQLLADQLATGTADARLRLTQALAEIPGAATTILLHRLAADPDQPVALTAQAVLRRRSPSAAPGTV